MQLFQQGTAESLQQAIIKWEQALPLWRNLGDKAQEALINLALGRVYDLLGFKPKALEYYNQALPIYQSLKDRSGEATTLNNIGGVYDALGEKQKSLDYYQQALPLSRAVGDRSGEATTLSNIGAVYNALGEKQKALDYYQQSLPLSRAVGDRSQEATTLSNIGAVYDDLGEKQKALDYYQQALPLRRAVGDRSGEATTLNNIGLVYSDLGEKQKALDYYQQALPLRRAVGDRSGEATTLNNIGGVYDDLGEKQKALDYYQQALPLSRAVGDRSGEARLLNNIGGVYSDLGEKQKALDYYQQSLPLRRAVGDRSGEARLLNNIGGVYSDLGEKQKALDYYQQSLPLSRAVGDRSGEAVTLDNIGYLLQQQNQPQLGIIFYKQSVNVYETLRGDIKGLPKELQQTYTETVADTYRRLADLLLQQDRILEAQRVLDLLKVQELDDYLRGVRRNTNTEQGVPKLPPEQKIDEGIEAILNKAVEIGQEISRLQERQKLNGKLTPSEEQRLAQLWKQQEQIVAEFNKFIESPEVLALINQLKPQTRSADLLNNLDNLIGLSDNLKKLQQNAVLIYPIIFDDRLEIILTTADSTPVRHTVKVSKKELNETIRAFRKALQNPNLDAKKPAQQLYEWLIKPLENNLKTADAKTIIYAPDGQLRYIPLAALYDGKQWLIERYRVNNITAASLTDFNTKPEPKMHILAAAFVKGSYQFRHEGQDFRFNGLPFAGIEVDKLAQTVSPTTKYFDKEFNQTIIPRLDSYTVVHFATHAAFLVGTPEQSFVLFGDGTVVTLQTMKNWRFKNIDLIVLSACETGLGGNYGTGIEILGLGYRLQTAGARAVIASLWSVDDGGTQALMNAFYAALRTGKLSKTEALQQAQIALITSNNPTDEQRRGSIRIEPLEGVPSDVANRLSHPHYWAPFILIGNGL
ncbi:MAG: tetratricopeptide repeat protein [Microcystis panniformis Mp_MB_F_20051200_S6D]|nr:MAG: tetratricopeptide repeat protein [Microcystis panniformis Mp_MB_F_20051200_S9D]TRV74167.1 MAG: tetratricopeptide repeat protein [Microcystis panniformis Mp_MB_F_20051200_S6D]TRV79627.1 MAG: tetratricopeptide repeat protein [Microcystis panniformis Mp_MB_F_20051200_S6]